MKVKREFGYWLVIGVLCLFVIGLISAGSWKSLLPEGEHAADTDDGAQSQEECAGQDGTGSIDQDHCASADPSSGDGDLKPSRAIATVGDKTVTLGEFYAYARAYYGIGILNQMLEEAVVAMEAERLDIEVTEEEIQRELLKMQQGYESEADFYRTMKEQLGMDREALERDIRYTLMLEKITTYGIEITDEELQEFLAQHPEEAMAGTRLHIQQIVVGSAKEAEEVKKQLEQGVPFEDLAAAYSDDSLFPNGDLGWVDWNDPFLPEELMEQARQMEEGEISPVIALPDQTYAFIKLQGKKDLSPEERALRMESLRKELALSRAPSMQDVLADLKRRYNVTVVDPDFR